MANEDARAEALRGLGVARRERPPSTPQREGEAPEVAEAQAEPTAEPALGAEAADEAGMAPGAPEDEPVAATTVPTTQPVAVTGLGIKRRRPPEAPARRGAAGAEAEGAEAEGAEAPVDGVAKPAGAEPGAPGSPAIPATRRLGSDQASVFLANYFKVRPEMRQTLPERTFLLKRTHGFYTGDGREQRKIFVGFEPALVVYTLPTFPEQLPEYTQPKNKGDWKTFQAELIDPGLHRQPTFAEDGFVVDAPFNVLGDSYVYVVFQSDGQPLVDAPVVEEEAAPTRGTGGGGLGIKRRQ
jgi:hypothetical protein